MLEASFLGALLLLKYEVCCGFLGCGQTRCCKLLYDFFKYIKYTRRFLQMYDLTNLPAKEDNTHIVCTSVQEVHRRTHKVCECVTKGKIEINYATALHLGCSIFDCTPEEHMTATRCYDNPDRLISLEDDVENVLFFCSCHLSWGL